MAKEKLLSIIVPVYNVEAYLSECIESLLQAGEDKIEIILVDDGSADSSGVLCDTYAQKHSCIKVVHKENEGPSIARNLGLDIANAKYVAFVDSDDKLSPGSLNAVINWAKSSETDLCFMKAQKLFPDGSTEDLGDDIWQRDIRGKNKQQIINYLSTRPKYPGSACSKLFRREFLLNNKLRFPESRAVAEDLEFCLDCFLSMESFDAMDMPYYEYRQNRTGSTTSIIAEKSFYGLAKFIEASETKLISDGKARSPMHEAMLSFAAYEYAILLWQYSQLPKEARSKAMAWLRENRPVMKYARTKKLKLILACTNLLGLGMTSKLLNVYMLAR